MDKYKERMNISRKGSNAFPMSNKIIILVYLLLISCQFVLTNTHHNSHHGAATFMPALECYDRSNKPQVSFSQ